jgi:hypothetical protein
MRCAHHEYQIARAIRRCGSCLLSQLDALAYGERHVWISFSPKGRDRVHCGTTGKPRANIISRSLRGDVGNGDVRGREHHPEGMNELLVGYARVSTEQQDLTVQRHGLRALGVGDDRIYVDHGLTGTNRARPGSG